MRTLYLMRHGIAEERSPAVDDGARVLTIEGRERTLQCARGLLALGVTPEKIGHSPLVRAAQTAQIVHEILGGALFVHEELAAAPTEELLLGLDGARVMLIGHEPWLGMLASLALTSSSVEGGLYPFKKGGVMHLEGPGDPGSYQLLGFYPPRALRRLRP